MRTAWATIPASAGDLGIPCTFRVVVGLHPVRSFYRTPRRGMLWPQHTQLLVGLHPVWSFEVLSTLCCIRDACHGTWTHHPTHVSARFSPGHDSFPIFASLTSCGRKGSRSSRKPQKHKRFHMVASSGEKRSISLRRTATQPHTQLHTSARGNASRRTNLQSTVKGRHMTGCVV